VGDRVAIVLAAGKGTRMKSDLPKVLFPVLGRPLIRYVLDAVVAAGIQRVLLVVGYQSDLVRRVLSDCPGIEFVEQREQLGTGHAVQVCTPFLVDFDGAAVIVTGDSPLTQSDSLRRLLLEFERDRPACVMGTLIKSDPTGLGRIVRDERNQFVGIVEHKDATSDQLAIREVNMSTYVFDWRELLPVLAQLSTDNRQGEYYITDCPGMLHRAGRDVRALPILQPCEALSINSIEDLRAVEEEMQRR
jgi:bifunctional UDP-N-acetylglucosamine pyrophosphorylase/glucosamine-1-phosphate N-acetyltransferase/UDP-N-acetylglucosamine pyrophosphorylase